MGTEGTSEVPCDCSSMEWTKYSGVILKDNMNFRVFSSLLDCYLRVRCLSVHHNLLENDL